MYPTEQNVHLLCSEQRLLVTRGRAGLGFEITNQIAEDVIIFA